MVLNLYEKSLTDAGTRRHRLVEVKICWPKIMSAFHEKQYDQKALLLLHTTSLSRYIYLFILFDIVEQCWDA